MTAADQQQTTDDSAGFFHDPLAGWGNDDLLLQESQRKLVQSNHPKAFRVLDWPELRSAFLERDLLANQARKATRSTGVIAVCLGYIGLLLAAASAIAPKSPVFSTQWDVVVSVAGALLIFLAGWIGFHAILVGGRKNQWIINRFWTERLRQFHFQFLINNFDLASEAMRTDEGLETYKTARQQALSTFVEETKQKLALVIDRMNSDDGETDPWIRKEWAREPEVPAESVEGEELFAALARQRLDVQERYVASKMLNRVTSSKWRLRVIRMWGDGLTVLVLVITMAVGLLASIANSTSTPPVTFLIFLSAALSGLVVALRAIEEGLQLGSDVERYSWYLASVRSLQQRFHDTRGRGTRLAIFREMEHLSYQELRRFTLSAQASRFIL